MVFLSYAREDQDQILYIYNYLKQEKLDPWIDIKQIEPGQIWENEIRKAMLESDIVLIFISKNSIRKVGYLVEELNLAKKVLDSMAPGKVNVLPVRLSNCKIPREFSNIQSWDFFSNRNLEALSLAIKKMISESKKSHNSTSKSNESTNSHQKPLDRIKVIKLTLDQAIKGCTLQFNVTSEEPCFNCDQNGYIKLTRCPHCLGTKKIKQRKKVRLNVHPGTYDGKQEIIRNVLPGDSTKNWSKDILIKYKIYPDDFFSFKGPDVECTIYVPVAKLRNGGKIKVKTIYGDTETIKLPAGTFTGTTFRLLDRGFKTKDRNGHQYVKIIHDNQTL